MTVHPTCGSTWTSPSAQHCAGCCVTFVGTAAGDRHRVGGFHSRHGRRCVPEFLLKTIGLKRDPRGIWGSTGTVRTPPEGWRKAGDAPGTSQGPAQSAPEPLSGVSGPTGGVSAGSGASGGAA